jgi:hypothetical protein
MNKKITEGDNVLLEQYKLYVEMADRVSARRIDTSKFYITLISGLLLIVPVFTNTSVAVETQKIAFQIFSLLGILLCGVWIINIRSYKELNSLKFSVIHEMEDLLPFGAYKREWELLRKDPKKTYIRLSRVEQFVPLLLVTPHIIIFLLVTLG